MYITSYRHFAAHRQECFDASHERLVMFRCRVCETPIIVNEINADVTVRAEGRCVGCVLDGKAAPAPSAQDVLDWALAGLEPIENPEVRQRYATIVVDLAMGYQRGIGKLPDPHSLLRLAWETLDKLHGRQMLKRGTGVGFRERDVQKIDVADAMNRIKATLGDGQAR